MEGRDKRAEATDFLLSQARAGDSRAEHALLDGVRDMAMQEARRHKLMGAVRRQHTEEDVAGELCLRMLGRGELDRFQSRGPGSLKRYIGFIVDGVMKDLTRRLFADKRGGGALPASLAEAPTSQPGLPHPAAGGPGPATAARATDLSARLEERLEGEQRDVWRLRFVEGLGFAEIAAWLGISESAARGLYARARQKLGKSGLLDTDAPGLGEQREA